jgi:transcriptional regulator with XRE-family HTH domain
VAARVRDLRQARGLTQEGLAERAGISISFVSMIERGERSPSYDTLLQLAQGLDLHVSELFRDGEPDAVMGPHIEPLLQFLRNARLNRNQVEKLTRVARALFSSAPAVNPAVRPRPPRGKICTLPGCGRPLLARGMCASHYRSRRRLAR